MVERPSDAGRSRGRACRVLRERRPASAGRIGFSARARRDGGAVPARTPWRRRSHRREGPASDRRRWYAAHWWARLEILSACVNASLCGVGSSRLSGDVDFQRDSVSDAMPSCVASRGLVASRAELSCWQWMRSRSSVFIASSRASASVRARTKGKISNSSKAFGGTGEVLLQVSMFIRQIEAVDPVEIGER